MEKRTGRKKGERGNYSQEKGKQTSAQVLYLYSRTNETYAIYPNRIVALFRSDSGMPFSIVLAALTINIAHDDVSVGFFEYLVHWQRQNRLHKWLNCIGVDRAISMPLHMKWTLVMFVRFGSNISVHTARRAMTFALDRAKFVSICVALSPNAQCDWVSLLYYRRNYCD